MPHWLPPNASTYGGQMDHLLLFITVIVGAWLLLAEAILFYFVFRYRRRKGQQAAYVPGNKRSQIAWVLVPCAVILCFDIAIDGAGSPVWRTIKENMPPPKLHIRVEGRQWAWQFIHPGPDGKLDTPDDISTMNEVHVPVHAVVRLDLESKDTVHSFWVPEFRLKQDVVPGRTIGAWFEATRPGAYSVLCAQLCGTAHGLMRGIVYVDDPSAYRAWLRAAADSARGATS
jgi:cytochrome c oxidase subunit 2